MDIAYVLLKNDKMQIPRSRLLQTHTAIIEMRQKIKKLTIQNHRLNHQRKVA